MKKTFRSGAFRAGALAATAALLLSACGSDTGSDSAGGTAGEGQGDTCTIENAVPLAALVSLTGPAASYGESQRDGLNLAIEHINEKEGVEYELTIEDDASDARQALTAMETVLGNDPAVVIGPTLATSGFQAQPIAQEESVPVLAISNTADGITDQGDFIFRDSLSEPQVIPQTLAGVEEKYDLEKVVLMHSNDDDFTKSGYDVMKSTLEESDVEIAADETFSVSDTDFRPLLTKALNEDPDAIVVSALIEAAIPFVTQARELGFDGPIIGGNGLNNPQLMADAGEAAEGVIVGAAWNSAADDPMNEEFKAAYEEAYGKLPDQFAAQAYAGIQIIDEAVRANCSTGNEDIQDAFNNIEGLETVLGSFSFTDNGDADHDAVVQIVEDGRFTILD